MDDIRIKEVGSFHIGGRKATLAGLPKYQAQIAQNAPPREVDPNGEFWVEQMYAQYIKLAEPKSKYPILFWHGGGLTGACWETTPDGREGWQMYFLRQGYDVYVSDAVERGRASWARYPEIFATEPVFRPYEQAWELFRLGKKYHSDPDKREVFAGVRFPTNLFDKLMMQAVPRWSSNNAATQRAYDEYVEKAGPCIIIVHSQGGAFAAQAAINNPDKVKALVFIEPTGAPAAKKEDLRKIAHIPHLYLWGDYLDQSPYWSTRPEAAATSYYLGVDKYRRALEVEGVDVTWFVLPETGIYGNTHAIYQDSNSNEIASAVDSWLTEKGLK